MSAPSYAPRPAFLDSLEGLRAVAAFGVMGTHLAFLGGIGAESPAGAVLARADYFVAVFFALSAFLLWRRHRRTPRTRVALARYARARVRRIVPAYVVVVLGVMLLVPAARGTSPAVWAATVTFTQIYLPAGLAPSLTHLWSMAVEVAFYAVLPWLPRRRWALVALAVASVGWAWVPFVAHHTPGGVNGQLFPPAFALWFAVGIAAAEWEAHGFPAWLRRAARWRAAWWFAAVVVLWVAAQPWFGPQGLVHPSPAEFSRRILAGALFAALVLLPYAARPAPSALAASGVRFLGRISYCVFLVHLPVVEIVMAYAAIPMFSGRWSLFLLTGVLSIPLTVAVAWLLYERVESRLAMTTQPAAATGHSAPV
ncbi:acyltransferase [Corynebacterium sp. 13CS0277]|uniref:acyltransferase family protein n=1 Tax=Corynebacterium sp. 13CS0277 TaxID=2071994 RepID=UPI000D026A0A|nr:acyltransferase [Corynebacterium sp. 13CS0277]PRQ11844.1 acyltransferase [Corynebacterium sp. 13CS0277]